MGDFVVVVGPAGQAHLAVHPVTAGEYRVFLAETGGTEPRGLRHIRSSGVPAIDVSQVGAVAYCAWLGSRTGRTLRLPRMAELEELMGGASVDALDAGSWPHHHGRLPELRGGLKPVFLCEWTSDVLAVPLMGGRPRRVLADIFYPPWLREGSNVGHVHASLLASAGYSFVTFRPAYDG
jgi:hypothetical protein